MFIIEDRMKSTYQKLYVSYLETWLINVIFRQLEKLNQIKEPN